MAYISKITSGGTTCPVATSLYGTCDTAAAYPAKLVTCADFDTVASDIPTGTTIKVKFTNPNGAAYPPTLNINSKGAISIMKGTIPPGNTAETSWGKGSVVSFTYDGTYWQMNDHLDVRAGATSAPEKVASTSDAGVSLNYARQDHIHGIDLATGDYNGQVKIAGKNVSVKGLGSAAYTNSTAYAAASHNHDSSYLTKSNPTGTGSFAVGNNVNATGDYSHAEGYYTSASGANSHAEGYYTCASSSANHAEGWSTVASGGWGSHAEGAGAKASGNYSHAEGGGSVDFDGDGDVYEYTVAYGEGSHAEGYITTAYGKYSHSGGAYTSASNYASRAIGHYNASMETGGSATNTTGTAFVIGNGTSSSAKANAFSVTFTGVVKAKSTITGSTTADYAEFFEWKDINSDNEDRVGLFVTFDEDETDKIRIANSTDTYILGIVSGRPFVLGNADCDVWNGMYLTDEFNREIMEPAPLMETVFDKETGESIEKQVLDENDNPVYQGTRPVLNPEYDPTLPYINRADRPEWAMIGMLGVLSVYDDGTCVPGAYCTVNDNGIATASNNTTVSYRVLKRLSDNIISILFR